MSWCHSPGSGDPSAMGEQHMLWGELKQCGAFPLLVLPTAVVQEQLGCSATASLTQG